jgi:hypothetical protein
MFVNLYIYILLAQMANPNLITWDNCYPRYSTSYGETVKKTLARTPINIYNNIDFTMRRGFG